MASNSISAPNQMCGVCLQEITPEQKKIVKCTHIFHRACFNRILTLEDSFTKLTPAAIRRITRQELNLLVDSEDSVTRCTSPDALKKITRLELTILVVAPLAFIILKLAILYFSGRIICNDTNCYIVPE